MLYQTEGIVLLSMDLGEHDRLITVLTAEEGLVKAVVKGARKPKSKLAAVTQPFSRAQFQLYRGPSMDRVTQVSLLDSHPGILGDYARLVYAGYLSEIVSIMMPERQENAEVYVLFRKILDYLENCRELWTAARWAELRLLNAAGFSPLLEACALCGEAAGPWYFVPQSGGIVCGKCKNIAPQGPILEVSAGSVRTLLLIASSPSCPNLVARGQVRQEAGLMMRQYIAHTLGKRPKSLSLLERLEDEGS